MAAHNEKGQLGELLAIDYFIKLGYTILHKNWRYKRLEVDIIASKGQMLYFIEVKCRTTNKFGFPEENVSHKKIRNLIDASAQFLFQFPEWKRIQFNVLSVTIGLQVEYYLIEDVYL